MKRIPNNHRMKPTGQAQAPTAPSELDGLINLGMKDEALRLARRSLQDTALTAAAFNEAVDAILILGDLKPWTRLINSAYERLPKQQRPVVRFMLMSFRNSCGDHEGVLQLVPKRFAGAFAFEELAYGMEAAFALEQTTLMEKLAKRLPEAIRQAQHPLMQSSLLLNLAEYLARKGEWDHALTVLEPVQANEVFCRNAVTAIVEIHAVRALLALQKGLALNEQFSRNFDPESEMMVPGNDREVQAQAAKEFRRLQKILERIVPEKRRKVLALHIEH